MALRIHVDNVEKHNVRNWAFWFHILYLCCAMPFNSKSLIKIHKKFKNMKKKNVEPGMKMKD